MIYNQTLRIKHSSTKTTPRNKQSNHPRILPNLTSTIHQTNNPHKQHPNTVNQSDNSKIQAMQNRRRSSSSPASRSRRFRSQDRHARRRTAKLAPKRVRRPPPAMIAGEREEGRGRYLRLGGGRRRRHGRTSGGGGIAGGGREVVRRAAETGKVGGGVRWR